MGTTRIDEGVTMVARKFLVHHNHSNFDVDYDTDDGLEVLKFQLFSLTSIPPDEQKILGGDDDKVISDDFDLAAISDKLRLVSIDDKQVEEGSSSDLVKNDAELLKSDEELARMLQAEEEKLMYQQFAASEDNGAMKNRIQPYVIQVLRYEDPIRQEAARKSVPVEQLEEKALVSLAKEGNFKPSIGEQRQAFLLQLLFWFKKSFSWVNSPPCDGCGNETTRQGMGEPLSSELQFGASRVELHRCNSCSRITRFPRYSDPLKLLETRKGRCGEWANCFTLYCCAFGYESRVVQDFTDHVWTECFSHLGRWMHLDPCEGVYDKPLLYEKGWNKKLNYVIAIAKDGVYDVTKRYTKNWHEVLSRRNITTESALSTILANITRECRRGFTSQVLSVLEDRDKKEAESLERDLYCTDDASLSLPARLSGDKEWRISRAEFGPDSSCSLSSSSCPVRMCVDEHVTMIYNAFSPVLTHFVSNSLSSPRAVKVLTNFRGFLIDMKRSPFKTRRVCISASSDGAQIFSQQYIPSFNELINALSLKSKVGADGNFEICLAEDPVKTSLALPVVFDCMDETIRNLRRCTNFGKDDLSFPLLKSKRLHSGAVLASGEEIPFGIATSAFDGYRTSKWEEPNGAKGCWIMYKVLDNQMIDLVAYELMSANDTPERDPMDWIIEGSNDGGSSWHVLDKQTSQKFEERFQRKTFKIRSVSQPSNAFRFRFLSVRDIQSTSRLQIGSIDLYTSN